MKLITWSLTDTGRKREHNEDNHLADAGLGLFAVADGMGGHLGGETASRIALEALRERVAASSTDLEAAAKAIEAERRKELYRSTDPVPAVSEAAAAEGTPPPAAAPSPPVVEGPPGMIVLRQAARDACHRIFDTALEDPMLRGMGTTLTALFCEGGRGHLVHAGDSRCFLFRDGGLRQLSDDHTWIGDQVRAGTMSEAEAKTSRYRHVITKSVGFERDVVLDTRGIALEAGDVFLLCSDGMSNHIDNDELERLLRTTWFRKAPQMLVDLANSRGGDDNVTVVVVLVANDQHESH